MVESSVILNVLVGMILVGACSLVVFLPTEPVRHFKIGKAKQKKAIEKAEEYSESLITQEDSFSREIYPSEINASTVDGFKFTFKMSAALTRGVSGEDEKNYDSTFKGREEVRRLIYELLVEEIRETISTYLRVFSTEQLYYYEHDFEKEIAKTVAQGLTRYGLVLSDFRLTIKRTAENIDISKAREQSFESIIAMVPQREDLREYLSKVRNEEPQPQQRRTQHSYHSLSARLERLESSWMEYERNPTLLLNYPLMSDASCDETANFFVRMEQVKALNEVAQNNAGSLDDFAAALEAAELAFVKAENNAKKIRHAYLTSEQRTAVERSRPLVAMYRDKEASPQERINAFKQANRNLEGIMILPERPIMGLLETAQ